jgi:hypothetical protein
MSENIDKIIEDVRKLADAAADYGLSGWKGHGQINAIADRLATLRAAPAAEGAAPQASAGEELPELPSPARTSMGWLGDDKPSHYFTPEQMRQYARDAIHLSAPTSAATPECGANLWLARETRFCKLPAGHEGPHQRAKQPEAAHGEQGDVVAALSARLREYATDCESSDDAETDIAGTFVPNVISGDFYDDLMAAAQALAQPPAAPDAVDAAMVERACAAFYADKGWFTNANNSRDFMRIALTAALAQHPPASGSRGVGEMDALVAAFNTWPADIRKKLSLHDLRRMTGWRSPSETPDASAQEGENNA